MFKVEIVKDEHQEGVRWLKASHNGVAWSLIEFRNDEEALQIMNALQQSVQADLLESCDCDRSSLHDCVCPQCRARYIASR